MLLASIWIEIGLALLLNYRSYYFLAGVLGLLATSLLLALTQNARARLWRLRNLAILPNLSNHVRVLDTPIQHTTILYSILNAIFWLGC